MWMTAAPQRSHSSWAQLSMTISVQRPVVEPHGCRNANISFKGSRLSWLPGSPSVQTRRVFIVFYSLFFCSLCLHLASKSCNAPFVRSSVALVRSRCAGQEYTPTSALMCSRGGICAPTGCPWHNWHWTSCYWSFCWRSAVCCEVFPWGKKKWLRSLALSVLNLGCVMWLVISILTRCHANSISKAVVPVPWRDGMFALHRHAGRCILGQSVSFGLAATLKVHLIILLCEMFDQPKNTKHIFILHTFFKFLLLLLLWLLAFECFSKTKPVVFHICVTVSKSHKKKTYNKLSTHSYVGECRLILA